jgi:hypothetical protein
VGEGSRRQEPVRRGGHTHGENNKPVPVIPTSASRGCRRATWCKRWGVIHDDGAQVREERRRRTRSRVATTHPVGRRLLALNPSLHCVLNKQSCALVVSGCAGARFLSRRHRRPSSSPLA